MKRFAALYRALDASTSTRDKQAALQRYFAEAPAADAAWAVYVLAGGKPRQAVPSRLLRAWALDATRLPAWLFEESYQTVGDLAETLSLLLPPSTCPTERGLAEWITAHLLPLRGQPADEQERRLRDQWACLPDDQRLVYFKFNTGGLRVGVSRPMVTQALAAVSGLDPKRIAQRLMGYTTAHHTPSADDYLALMAPESAQEQQGQGGQPYPFFLAHPLAEPVDRFEALLGPPGDWIVEWKWDGIRAQLVRRSGSSWLWSRGEELVSDRFPELAAMGDVLPDGTVIDGEILVWRNGSPRPFAELQKRITRKTLTPKLLQELPAALLAYDLIEHQGQDARSWPLAERRARLEALVQALAHPSLRISPRVIGDTWQALASEREQARALGTEGFMLKHVDSRYGVGRTKADGTWWKWKIEPMTADAVLIYAQRGHGRRASVYSDYTFAVWDAPAGTEGRQLVPFAKAYSGLTDAEMAKVDTVIRQTTIDSFGPVRSVRPTLVFELGFEGIGRSPRHKSGLAVRFPRMLRWRTDKSIEEADTLQTLAALLPDGSA